MQNPLLQRAKEAKGGQGAVVTLAPSPFTAKNIAAIERNAANMGVEGPESYNDDYAAFALALTEADICARFWAKVEKLGPFHPLLGSVCWLWTANVVGHGSKSHPTHSRHGQFTYRLSGRRHQYHVYAHRFAWGLAHGPIPRGLNVLHRCDVYPCVNEAHLFLGTQDDNMKDAARKNRFTVPRTRTLSLIDRLTIYQMPAYRGIGVDLAQHYGVTKSAITIIRAGRFIGSGVWTGTKDNAQSDVEIETVIKIRRLA